jgi:lysyl-tRNA synthetase class 1
MFWADKLAGEIAEKFGKEKPILIRDEKTVSGRVHVGSMRGAAVHGTLFEALNDAGVPAVFKWEHNDFDPMDDIPVYLDRATYEPHLGKPLKYIPSPEPGFASYAEYFAEEFQKVIEAAGWHPEFYWGSSLYENGEMDGVIREALEHAQDIVRIYREVSGSRREDAWLPINVICPQCGKVTTTEASDFDSKTVEVHCRPDKAPYTKGCDFRGRVSPFGGKAKLPWKVEWPAKWKVVGVMLEGAGKDHSTKGGSRDVASHISTEVFKYEPPFDAPYEFFLVGGRKMSSSKGRGSAAGEISALVPTKIFRLALIGKDISQQVNFDPEGDTIPVLFDQYDKLAEGYWTGVKDDYARLFEFLHPGRVMPEKMFLMRFSQVAFVAQMPHMDLYKEAEGLKGSALTDAEKAELDERATYAKKWLELYAPEKFVFELQKTLPEAAQNLNENQKKAFVALREFIESAAAMPSGEDLHAKLHALKEEVPIAPAELFGAIYQTFLGKQQGPKAGWFLSVLDKEFVLERLREASK